MALPNDGNPITLEPASDSNHAVLHSVKLMEEDVERMLEAGKDLTITLDDSGKGTLKVGKDSRSIHIRPENERNYECYYRDGQRSTMVAGVSGCMAVEKKLSTTVMARQGQRVAAAERQKHERQLVVDEGVSKLKKARRRRSAKSTTSALRRDSRNLALNERSKGIKKATVRTDKGVISGALKKLDKEFNGARRARENYIKETTHSSTSPSSVKSNLYDRKGETSGKIAVSDKSKGIKKSSKSKKSGFSGLKTKLKRARKI